MTPNFFIFLCHVNCSVKRTLCVLSASFSAVFVGWKLSSETTNLKKEMYMNVFRMRVLQIAPWGLEKGTPLISLWRGGKKPFPWHSAQEGKGLLIDRCFSIFLGSGNCLAEGLNPVKRTCPSLSKDWKKQRKQRCLAIAKLKFRILYGGED